ncbi:MAG: hypothetical protein LBH04_08860 [Tannerellaceae bacterium]|nr:hypothetical protein [Tannerellaceae bacterium]
MGTLHLRIKRVYGYYLYITTGQIDYTFMPAKNMIPAFLPFSILAPFSEILKYGLIAQLQKTDCSLEDMPH